VTIRQDPPLFDGGQGRSPDEVRLYATFWVACVIGLAFLAAAVVGLSS